MKKKEKTQIHTLTIDDLRKRASEAEQQLAKATVDRFTKQVKNVHEVKAMRKRLAIIKTILRQKEHAHA